MLQWKQETLRIGQRPETARLRLLKLVYPTLHELELKPESEARARVEHEPEMFQTILSQQWFEE